MIPRCEISTGCVALGCGLFLTKYQTLVIGDIHFGASNELQKKGLLVPLQQKKRFFDDMNLLYNETTPKKLILLGDIKHVFGSIERQEWSDVLELIDWAKEKQVELICIKGNHDVLLQPILSKKNVPLESYVLLGENVFTHGDTLLPDSVLLQAKRIIIGHEHPSVLLDDGVRKEKFKCFLKARYKQKELIIVPSMFPLVEGSDVLSDRALGPFLKRATRQEVFVVGDDYVVLPFGNKKYV